MNKDTLSILNTFQNKDKGVMDAVEFAYELDGTGKAFIYDLMHRAKQGDTDAIMLCIQIVDDLISDKDLQKEVKRFEHKIIKRRSERNKFD